ncbi:MAG: rhamnogalacturonan acetylesterase [Undibacterium sp.]|nr:rhamnogalacturonan acetylesterase [Opitutaceae bacterium]
MLSLTAFLTLAALAAPAVSPSDTTLPPPLAAPEAVAATPLNPALPTLFIAGDSTAAKGPPTATGWGVPFADYFDATKINLVNAARGGRSSRTFIREGLWDQLLAKVKAGDTVLIQFGHNDAGAINDASRARGSIRSVGEETEQIDNLLTKQPELVHTYGWYLRKMIADVRAKKATPVLLSITIRNEWKDGKVERANGPWSVFTAELGKTENVAFIDLTSLIADDYERRGAEAVKPFFLKDHTHTDPAGADLSASLVVAALKNLNGAPFARVLSAKGQAVAAAPLAAVVNATRASRAQPVPADPKLPTLFLIGDSTVRNGQGDGNNGQWGWGEPLVTLFDPKKINVVNRAVGGLSSRTFLTLGHWEKTLALTKPGDFVVMQFGHNDNGALNDEPPPPLRARGTIRGTGDEAVEIDNVMTKKHEVVHTYGWYLRRFIADARDRGVTPIVASLVPRKSWTGGHINRAPYAAWSAGVAHTTKTAFIPLNEIVAIRYEALGAEGVEKLFADANTHTSIDGAELNAASVVAALKSLPGAPLDSYLVK